MSIRIFTLKLVMWVMGWLLGLPKYASIPAAQDSAKLSQTIKIYGYHQLTSNVYLARNLTFRPSSTLDLNNCFIECINNHIITLNNGTVSPASVCCTYNSANNLIGLYSSISQLPINPWNTISKLVLKGSHTFSSAFTVPSGKTIELVSGSNVTFSGGLTVNGNLITNGASLTFAGGTGLIINGSATCTGTTFTGSWWSGISSNNAYYPSFSNCNINYATNGVNTNNCYVTLNGCRITNNYYGTFFTNYGLGEILHTGFNNNYDAVNGDINSDPIITPSNSFRGSTHYDIYSTAWMLTATDNYWANKKVTNNVDATGDLNYDPYPKLSESKESISETPMFKKTNVSIISTKNESNELFYKARLFFKERKYDTALSNFKTIADNYSDSLVGRSAIVFIEYILDKTAKGSEISVMLDSYASKKGRIAPFAAYRKGYIYFRIGEYQKALDIMKSVTFAKDDIEMEKVRLLDLGIINYDCLDKKSEGLKYFNELVTKYPDDRLSEKVCTFYGIKKGSKDNNKNYANSVNITETVLLSNYPNPFNPSTVIKYNIAENTNVTLKVFDVLGKEVTTLVNEYKTKGAYDVKFNGTGLASGLYFYQLKAGNTNQIMKMILTK